jgi:hypothetical protein
MLFQWVQIVYWIALATWFGTVLAVALFAPVIFHTVRESNPILPDVLSVNLEGQHGTLLAGSIVANILRRLVNVELICAIVLLITLIIQPFIIDMNSGTEALSGNKAAAFVRSILFLAALALVLLDWWVVWPRLLKFRDQYIEHADEPEIANPAKDEFDREHKRSVSLMSIVLFLLLGMILFSANITPPRTTIPAQTSAGK